MWREILRKLWDGAGSICGCSSPQYFLQTLHSHSAVANADSDADVDVDADAEQKV